MRRLSTSERTVNPAGYAKPEELDADRAIKEHALALEFLEKGQYWIVITSICDMA
jgi:hypothetical protein